MAISGISRSHLETPVVDNTQPMSRNAESDNPQDMVHVSHDALLLTEALRVAQNAPDVRIDKVEELRAKIANGTYQIDTKKLAINLIREAPELFEV